MFADLKLVVDLLRPCVSAFRTYKSGNRRKKLILELLQTYFLMKDCVSEGKQLVDEAGRDPICRINSMDQTSAESTLERWDAVLSRQSRRLLALQELVIGQNHLAVIDPDTQAQISEVVGYKLERANSLHGIGAALLIRFMFPIAKLAEDRAKYVSVMAGSESDLLDVGRIEQEISALRQSLENFRELVLRLLSDDEITRFSDQARETTTFE